MTKLNWNNAGLRQADPARVQPIVDFSTPDPVVIGKKKTRKKKNKRRKDREAVGVVYPVPSEKVALIASIMNDMGRTFPTRSVRVKAELERLIAQNVIGADGKPNAKHQLIRSWMERVEKLQAASANGSPVRGTVQISSNLLRPVER
jgi:hypothetical protein